VGKSHPLRVPGLRPGQILKGRVEALLGPGRVLIRVEQMTLEADTHTELCAGDRVVLRAGTSGFSQRFQVISRKSAGLYGLHVRA